MVRSLNAREDDGQLARFQGAKRMFRDARPWLAIIAGFAAVALLIDFCFVCVLQALR